MLDNPQSVHSAFCLNQDGLLKLDFPVSISVLFRQHWGEQEKEVIRIVTMLLQHMLIINSIAI